MPKVMIEVEEGAVEVLDDFIKEVYSVELFWKHHGGYDIDTSEMGHPYRLVLIDKQEAKILAKAFGLYPYNQAIVHEPEIKDPVVNEDG